MTPASPEQPLPMMFSEAELGPRAVPRKGHAARPGSGPPGHTCRQCVHYSVLRRGHTYRKCGLAHAAWTHGPATDIRASDPACQFWTRST
jgi:hypothetical protein